MGFLFGGNTGETAESLAARRAMADALIKNGSDMSNIRSPMEGFGKLLQQLGGRLEERRIAQESKQGRDAIVSALGKAYGYDFSPATPQEEPGILGSIFGGGKSAPTASPVQQAVDAAPAPSGNPSYRDAIANIESRGSGDYSAVGPTDDKMGRALGRYQIMEANIGPWSREVLGREVTPQEFMANPQLQDAIFDGKFGQYVNQFGPEGAAQAWFGGPGSVGKGDRKDVLGTTVAEYGDRFMAGLGGGQEPAAFAAQPGMAATASPALGYAEQPAAPPLPAPIDVATRQVMPDMSMRHGGDAPPTLDPQQGILRAMNGFSGPEPGASGPFPPAPGMEAQAQNAAPGSRLAAVMAAMSSPYLDPGTSRLVSVLLEQEMGQQQAQRELQLKQADPAYQMGLEKDRLVLENLKHPKPELKVIGEDGSGNKQYGWVNPVDQSITPVSAPQAQAGSRLFNGNSVDAQALNFLVTTGKLSKEQAAQMAAGKTVSGPNGELLFLTPDAVFGGQQENKGVDIFGEGQTAPQTAPVNTGMLKLTQPKVSESEKNAMTYADRMAQAGAILDEMGTKGSGTIDRLAGEIPLIGGYLTSDDFKKADQAKRDFINAQLRRESGAAIGASEFENADKQYFPQPGDSKEVILQKAKNRKTVIEGMKRDAGPTYNPPVLPDGQRSDGPPHVGAVMDGYRFKGGDPADPNSWEKI